MLGLELLAQLLLGVLALLQLGHLLVINKDVGGDCTHEEKTQRHGAGPHGQGPATRIAPIECLQLFNEIHCAPRLAMTLAPGRPLPLPPPLPSSWPAVDTCWAYSVKLEPGVLPSLPVWTTSSSGLRSQSEPSMLRMNEDTRVLDWATPSNLNFLSVCFTPVRYTPSGSVRTISSNTCTISGRERCSFSMI